MCRNRPQTIISSSSSSSIKQLNPFAKPFEFTEKSTSNFPAPEKYFPQPPALVHYHCFTTVFVPKMNCQAAEETEETITVKNPNPKNGRVGRPKCNEKFRPFYGGRRVVPPRLAKVEAERRQARVEVRKSAQAKMEAKKPRPAKMEVKQVWVPKQLSYKVDDAPRSPPVSPLLHHDVDDQKTSVMMRNIPNRFRRDDLLGFLDKYCLDYNLEYDFVYLPVDFRHHNKGYAFINFTKSDYARLFQELLTGYKWRGQVFIEKNLCTSDKTCEITWANIQGKDCLVRHFNDSNFPCYNVEYLPVELSPPSKGSAFASTLIYAGRYLGTYCA